MLVRELLCVSCCLICRHRKICGPIFKTKRSLILWGRGDHTNVEPYNLRMITKRSNPGFRPLLPSQKYANQNTVMAILNGQAQGPRFSISACHIMRITKFHSLDFLYISFSEIPPSDGEAVPDSQLSPVIPFTCTLPQNLASSGEVGPADLALSETEDPAPSQPLFDDDSDDGQTSVAIPSHALGSDSETASLPSTSSQRGKFTILLNLVLFYHQNMYFTT